MLTRRNQQDNTEQTHSLKKKAAKAIFANTITKQPFEQIFGNWPIAAANNISQSMPLSLARRSGGSQLLEFSRIAFAQEENHKAGPESTQLHWQNKYTNCNWRRNKLPTNAAKNKTPTMPRTSLSTYRICSMLISRVVLTSISGLVVEYIVAIDVTRVRFPADAICLSVFARQAMHGTAHFRGDTQPQENLKSTIIKSKQNQPFLRQCCVSSFFVSLPTCRGIRHFSSRGSQTTSEILPQKNFPPRAAFLML